MRTKLFFAFIFIVLFALLSNVVYERLIISDFDEFIKGTEEDHIYWVMASVEGSYHDGNWEKLSLNEALHWGLMLGLDAYVEDVSGLKILSSSDVISSMNPNMKKRMNLILELESGADEFIWYPLYVEGEEIGKLYISPIERFGSTAVKEAIFRKRGREFLVISFLIAGGGALFISVLFTMFLSNPLRRLTVVAAKIAEGDFAVQSKVQRKGRIFRQKDEIDKLTDTFNYMAEALRREDALRKHLSANVAHELRTPLTIIKGNLEAIEDGVITDTRVIISNINSEIQRMISLVEGIEDVTSAEASFFKKGELQEIDLREFIESIAEGMKKLFEEKGLFIRTDGPPVVIKTYPEKLHIILKNLLTNAYKFTTDGGIKVTWNDSSKDENTGFTIIVEDSGKGMAKEELPKVFERFYKGKESSGRGLGLAIVKELTGVMGGEVEVESRPDEGSRFILKF